MAYTSKLLAPCSDSLLQMFARCASTVPTMRDGVLDSATLPDKGLEKGLVLRVAFDQQTIDRQALHLSRRGETAHLRGGFTAFGNATVAANGADDVTKVRLQVHRRMEFYADEPFTSHFIEPPQRRIDIRVCRREVRRSMIKSPTTPPNEQRSHHTKGECRGGHDCRGLQLRKIQGSPPRAGATRARKGSRLSPDPRTIPRPKPVLRGGQSRIDLPPSTPRTRVRDTTRRCRANRTDPRSAGTPTAASTAGQPDTVRSGSTTASSRRRDRWSSR
jgi:hypothetical protein